MFIIIHRYSTLSKCPRKYIPYISMHYATLVLVFQVLLHALPPSSALRIFPQSTLLRSPLQPFDQPSPGIGSNKNWGRHEALAHPLCQHISTLTNSGVSTINQINQLRCSLASCLCCPCCLFRCPSPNSNLKPRRISTIDCDKNLLA